MGPALGPHTRTDRTRDTRVAEPRPPAPEDGRPGEGQRLTPDAPHNGGRPPPPGTAPHHPHGTQPAQGMQARGTVLGPHTHTPAPTARGWRTPTARPVGGQLGEGERLTSDAPKNGGRHPSGDALPQPTQGATTALKGARCGAGAGSPRPHRPQPGHTGHGTPGYPPQRTGVRGRDGTCHQTPLRTVAGHPPRGRPPHPWRHGAPTGHASQGDSVGPPHPHTRAHSTWVADPNSPPSGRAVGGGGAPNLRRPSQRWKAPPPGDALPPAPQRAMPARKGARCGTGTGSPRPQRPHPEHTGRGTPAARRRRRAVGGGTALNTRRPSQQWQASPPRGRPPTTPTPRHAAPTGHAGQGDSVRPPHSHIRAHNTWVADPNSPPSGRAVGGGEAPDLRRPSQQQPQARYGGTGTGLPPPRSTPDGARDRGRTRRGARTTWNGPTSAQCRDSARCARHITQGRGERTPRERERTHTQRARGDYQKGNWTELADCTDRVEWRTSERG